MFNLNALIEPKFPAAIFHSKVKYSKLPGDVGRKSSSVPGCPGVWEEEVMCPICILNGISLIPESVIRSNWSGTMS